MKKLYLTKDTRGTQIIYKEFIKSTIKKIEGKEFLILKRKLYDEISKSFKKQKVIFKIIGKHSILKNTYIVEVI